MNNYPRLAERLFNTPLLLSPEKADTIASVFNAYLLDKVAELPKYEPPMNVEVASSLSLRRADGGYYTTNEGVAVVQVHGSLVQRGGGLRDMLSGMTGYNTIGAQISAAMRDSSVRGLILEFDSQGGEVEGVVDLASTIADVDKPVWAHANGIALSGAYWLAVAADKIYTSPTGMLGSIGVLMMHADRSKVMERAGVVYTPIYAGAHKVDGSPMAPLSEDARTWAQNRVNHVYDMFVDHVAGNRGLSEDDVRATEAGILSAGDAVDAGLADGIALLGETIHTMAAALWDTGLDRKKRYRRAAASAQSHRGETDMSNQPDKAAAPAQPAAITQADLDKARADGEASAAAKAKEEAKAAVANITAAATARIKAITESASGKDHPALAKKLAFDTDMSPEAAQALMDGLPKEAQEALAPVNALAAKMAAEAPNPKVGASTTEEGDEDSAIAVRVASYARRRPLISVK